MHTMSNKDYWNYFRKIKITKHSSISFYYKASFFSFVSPILNFSIGKWYIIIRINKRIYANGYLNNVNVYNYLKNKGE